MMRCPRCHGLLVSDMLHDVHEEKAGHWYVSHCVNCGHYTDGVMEHNRTLTQDDQQPKRERNADFIKQAIR